MTTGVAASGVEVFKDARKAGYLNPEGADRPLRSPVPHETLAAARAYRLGRIREQLARHDAAGILLYDPCNIRYALDSSNMQVWTLHNATRYALILNGGPALDQRLAVAGIPAAKVRGYKRTVASHLEVAHFIADGLVDVGMGVRSAAGLLGLDFIPLQEERYDLVIPTPYLTSHPALTNFLDAIVSRPFRTEIEALGGYDTRQTGKIQDLWVKT